MDFLRNLFKKREPVNRIFVEKPVCLYEAVLPESYFNFNWIDYQTEFGSNSSTTTIGGPCKLQKAPLPADFYDNFCRGGERLFSPSGRWILEEIYERKQQEIYSPSHFLFYHVLNDVLGLQPLIQIIDYSNRKGMLYANEKLISNKEVEQVLQSKVDLMSSYWLSDTQLVSVYHKHTTQWFEKGTMGTLIQCLITIDHERRTYREELFEYGDVEGRVKEFSRAKKNPLFIGKKGYYTSLAVNILYLIPWIPSKDNSQNVIEIVLNCRDPLLINNNYRLIVGQEGTMVFCGALYFNHGSRVYFYINNRSAAPANVEYVHWWNYDHDETNRGLYIRTDRMVYIDFSRYTHIDFTKVNQFPFELVHLDRIDDIIVTEDASVSEEDYNESSDDGSSDIDWNDDGSSDGIQPIPSQIAINVDVLIDLPATPLQFHGRYITYVPPIEAYLQDPYIFDLETMTWSRMPEEWASDANKIFHNNSLFLFDEDCLTEIRLGPQPKWKSLYEMCRQKLLYSDKSIEIPSKLLNIIFPTA